MLQLYMIFILKFTELSQKYDVHCKSNAQTHVLELHHNKFNPSQLSSHQLQKTLTDAMIMQITTDLFLVNSADVYLVFFISFSILCNFFYFPKIAIANFSLGQL